MLSEILEVIWSFADETRVPFLEKVLQTQFGGYGYGDQLAGVRTPILRQIASRYKHLPVDTVEQLLHDQLHEARFVALVILIHKFKKNPGCVCQTYLNNTTFVNNWDLVDISAPHIVGNFCVMQNDDTHIWNLAKSTNLWENRIAIVSSWAFVKQNQLTLTTELCKYLINHNHHLIHKACGWMLREVGKKDPKVLIAFLQKYQNTLPRITLSYAKEKL